VIVISGVLLLVAVALLIIGLIPSMGLHWVDASVATSVLAFIALWISVRQRHGLAVETDAVAPVTSATVAVVAPEASTTAELPYSDVLVVPASADRPSVDPVASDADPVGTGGEHAAADDGATVTVVPAPAPPTLSSSGDAVSRLRAGPAKQPAPAKAVPAKTVPATQAAPAKKAPVVKKAPVKAPTAKKAAPVKPVKKSAVEVRKTAAPKKAPAPAKKAAVAVQKAAAPKKAPAPATKAVAKKAVSASKTAAPAKKAVAKKAVSASKTAAPAKKSVSTRSQVAKKATRYQAGVPAEVDEDGG
jgi:hypothetical protein